jgi:hypothetical protein
MDPYLARRESAVRADGVDCLFNVKSPVRYSFLGSCQPVSKVIMAGPVIFSIAHRILKNSSITGIQVPIRLVNELTKVFDSIFHCVLVILVYLYMDKVKTSPPGPGIFFRVKRDDFSGAEGSGHQLQPVTLTINLYHFAG